MLTYDIDLLIPQLTRPLANSDDIRNILTAQRDIIHFVHDQTVRFMNKGNLILNIIIHITQHSIWDVMFISLTNGTQQDLLFFKSLHSKLDKMLMYGI